MARFVAVNRDDVRMRAFSEGRRVHVGVWQQALVIINVNCQDFSIPSDKKHQIWAMHLLLRTRPLSQALTKWRPHWPSQTGTCQITESVSVSHAVNNNELSLWRPGCLFTYPASSFVSLHLLFNPVFSLDIYSKKINQGACCTPPTRNGLLYFCYLGLNRNFFSYIPFFLNHCISRHCSSS